MKQVGNIFGCLRLLATSIGGERLYAINEFTLAMPPVVATASLSLSGAVLRLVCHHGFHGVRFPLRKVVRALLLALYKGNIHS